MNDTRANKLLLSLFDDGSVLPIDDAAENGLSGVGAAYGSVDGNPVYAFALESETLGGGFGKSGAAKVAKIYSLAAKTGAPVVGIYDAKGVRMGEGNEILTSIGECLQWTNRLSGVVPQISVVTGSCGGSMAMLAAGADLLVISKDAEFFLSAPDVVAAASGSKKDTSSAKLAAENGCAAVLVDSAEDAVRTAAKLLGYLPANNLAAAPVFDFTDPSDDCILDADSFVELYAESGKSFKVGFATIGGTAVGVVKTVPNEKGTVCPGASGKAARFVRLCDAYNLPIVSVLDAKGYTPSAEAEGRGAALAASKLANAYADATTAKISLITGYGVGPLYIAMAGKSANTDLCFAYESAKISPLGIEASVIVTMGDRLAACNSAEEKNALFDEYAATKASAAAAASVGLVDQIVTKETARACIISALAMLSGKRESRMPKKHGVLSI